MVSVLPFFSLFIIPLLTFIGIDRGGPWLWATPIFAFLFLPLLDPMAGDARERIEISQGGERLANLLLWFYVPVQIGIPFFGASKAPELSANAGWGVNAFALALTTGALTGGIGITLAHELVHRREAHSYWAGIVLLASSFGVEY